MGKRLAVAGYPILHSKSPLLHQMALAHLNSPGISFRIASSCADELLNLAEQLELDAINITAPLKETLYSKILELDAQAQSTAALNLMIKKEHGWSGFNTDPFGVRKQISPFLSELKANNAIILGAGGAARAICHVLSKEKINFVVSARDFAKAKNIVDGYSTSYVELNTLEFNQALSMTKYIFNTISDRNFVVEGSVLNSQHLLFDAHYADKSALSLQINSVGGRVVDGSSWFIAQAQESIRLILGIDFSNHQIETPLFKVRKQSECIVLIGMMASGKSSVGLELASELNYSFIDLDREISVRENCSISEIFKDRGERYFRELETKILKESISKKKLVIAAGGGVTCKNENRELLKHACVVHLWADIPELMKRLGTANTGRPLLDNKDLQSRLRELKSERLEQMLEVTELLLNTQGLSAKQVAQKLAYEINLVRVS